MEKRKMLAKSHADEFKKQNPRFSHSKFYAAAGIPDENNLLESEFKVLYKFPDSQDSRNSASGTMRIRATDANAARVRASRKLLNKFGHEAKARKQYSIVRVTPVNMVKEDFDTIINEDSVTDNLVANVKDALMYLKIQGDDKIPTNVVMNEFKKRGMDVSLEQLQQLFPQGNDFLKNITSSYVEFNNNQPEAPKSFSQVQDNREKVGDMALGAVKKRK